MTARARRPAGTGTSGRHGGLWRSWSLGVTGFLRVFLAALVSMACSCGEDEAASDAATLRVAPKHAPAPLPSTASGPPRLLYLPDASRPLAQELLPVPGPTWAPSRRCPADMVDVDGRFCIDRFEAILIDAETGRRISPHYHPTRAQTRASLERWRKKALGVGPAVARAMPVPAPPDWQLEQNPVPKAAVRRDELPNGYLSRNVAERACANAGKRLCTSEEWVTACRGRQSRKYPYGDAYEEGKCNVFRTTHPARALHGDPSRGHLDPRLNLVEKDGDPLLRRTGATPSCRSDWGGDGIYDMVGNLDEWVSDAGGVFLGGFYARNTEEGCDARVEVHAPSYFDYSLGVRCCR